MESRRNPGIDRLRELSEIGSGCAASAFSDVAGRPILALTPKVCGGRIPPPARDCETGIFFEASGEFAGLVALLLPRTTREAVERHMLGPARAENPGPLAASAVEEFGNILVSRMLSAIADELGARILVSVPALFLRGAQHEATQRIAQGEAGSARPYIASELVERDGELRAILVLAPASQSWQAP